MKLANYTAFVNVKNIRSLRRLSNTEMDVVWFLAVRIFGLYMPLYTRLFGSFDFRSLKFLWSQVLCHSNVLLDDLS